MQPPPHLTVRAHMETISRTLLKEILQNNSEWIFSFQFCSELADSSVELHRKVVSGQFLVEEDRILRTVPYFSHSGRQAVSTVTRRTTGFPKHTRAAQGRHNFLNRGFSTSEGNAFEHRLPPYKLV